MFEVLYKNPATIERYRLAPRYSASYLLSDIGGTAVLVASFALASTSTPFAPCHHRSESVLIPPV